MSRELGHFERNRKGKSGEWRVESGEWRVENGEWKVESEITDFSRWSK
ncbi:MAG: hypothetical protein R3214_08235 [Christiangramia sp.]|nr:hypothetical protein [Christiangramia sp.]